MHRKAAQLSETEESINRLKGSDMLHVALNSAQSKARVSKSTAFVLQSNSEGAIRGLEGKGSHRVQAIAIGFLQGINTFEAWCWK